MLSFLRKKKSPVERKKFEPKRLVGITLIACDVDGTLLNKQEAIGPTVVALIKAIVKHGIQFVLITRRHHDAAEVFADDLMLETPIISLDGALIRSPHVDTPIHTNTFNQEIALDVIEEMRETENLDYCAITSARLLVSNPEMMLPAQHEFWNIETEVISGADDIKDEILEIAATGDFFAVNRVFDYIDEKTRQTDLRIRVYESHHKGGNWHLEMRSVNATKLSALQFYLNSNGMSMKDVVGIGDHYNDVDFCKKTGYVVTVRNAISQMKELADFITLRDCLDDGLEEFFEAFCNARGIDISHIPGLTKARTSTRRRRS